MIEINGKEYSLIGTNEEANIWYMSREIEGGEIDDNGDPEQLYVVAWGKEVIQSDVNVDNGHEGILYFGNDSDEAFGTFIYKMNNLDGDEEFQRFSRKFG